ncbi:DUF3592 domain-containing protein [Rubellimicrobium roseum]|uniref:DUF3592 domain-containing protein n=1 Tax=Rubellimicrobium roseum TaxID=687525 RepID=A0A5C4NA19_9RHOB|nr:DUF3592 domain-containing protein [Rubellimicrobium roseum]TNC71681.1 DUF3592 domain-containing protein [Rubellimicrobium roseum]
MIVDYLKKGGFAALMLATVALGGATLWTDAGATERALDDHGVTTRAYVVQRQPAAEGTEALPRVTYLYRSGPVDGAQRTHRIAHEVPQAVYDEARVGERVEIRYLPESPAIAEVHAGEFTDGRTSLDVMALVAALVAALAAAGVAVGGLGLARRPGVVARAA